MMIQPLTDWAEAAIRISTWKKAGQKIVFTNGCFDILHPGHIHLLAQAKNLGDKLIIGLNTDDSVRRLKGPTRPIKDEQSRGVVLSALVMVDLVVLFDQDTPLNIIKLLKPDVLVKGGDYQLSEIVGAEEVQEYGGEVRIIPFLPGYSSSNFLAST